MKRERSPGSASAAVAPSSPFPSRRRRAALSRDQRAVGVCRSYRPALIRFQAAGRFGRGLPLPSREGAGACLPR
jgi:hypothetical protein